MAGEYVEDPDDVFNYKTDWQEVVGDTQSGNGSFSWESQQDVRMGYVPWNKLRSAARYFLGYTYCDAASPYLLHRQNPSPHPVFPWLRCDHFGYAGVGPKANANNADNTPNVNSPFWTFPDQLRSTQYTRALVTLRYQSFRHRFLEDAAIATSSDEWMRSCFIECENQLDVLTADGLGQLIFAEGAGAGTGPTAGKTTFPAPVPVLLPKGQYAINWYGLPFDYLSGDPDVFYPTKILKCLGKVNSKDFITGDVTAYFPAGTVLMKAVRYQIFPWPVASADPTRPLLGVHLQIPIEYFNPDKGIADSPPGTSPWYGHNLMPWRGAKSDVTGGKFFYATRGGQTTDPPLLESFDFNNVWYHVSAPYLP